MTYCNRCQRRDALVVTKVVRVHLFTHDTYAWSLCDECDTAVWRLACGDPSAAEILSDLDDLDTLPIT